MAWERPDQFRKVLSTIGSFTNIRGGGKYPEIVKAADKKPIRVFQQDGAADLDNQFGNWPAANKAMGDVQVEVQTGKWAMYTGDLNQDDFIDGNDFPAFDTDSFNGVNTVYVATDMNGDGFVDGNDFPVFDVNSFNGVSAVYP